jgi:hypothetical protein
MTIRDKSNLTSEELVRSWDLDAPLSPTQQVFTKKVPKPRGGGYYLVIGGILGALIGFVTFAGAYIYCISEYGFCLSSASGGFRRDSWPLSSARSCGFFGGRSPY